MSGFLFLAGAAVLLAVGAELFADNAASAGRRLGVGALTVGVLLAGAEPEELVTAVLAAVRGQPGIAVGDALGANITLLTLALGVLGLASVVALDTRIRDYAIGAGLAGLAGSAAVADGVIGRVEGAGLIIVFVVLVAIVWRRDGGAPAIGELAELDGLDERPDAPDPDGDLTASADVVEPARGPARGLALAVVGLSVMGAGGWAAVTGAERIVAGLGIAETAVGLTLVALATSAEFVALVPAAARRGMPELAVAGIIGSVAYNATVTLGGAALARPLVVEGLGIVAPAAVVLAALVALAALVTDRLPRWVAALLVMAYLLYVALLLG